VVWNSLAEAPAAPACADESLPQFAMRLVGQRFVSLGDAQRHCSAQELCGKRLYALAGIGDPSRFFAQLAALGLEFEAHPFPDHHFYAAADIAFAADGVLLMTEKDAVKCAGLTSSEAWVLPVDAHIAAAADGKSLLDTILEKIDGRAPA
jgi:tetraacyldisaccharide 4'-kinase